MPSKTTDQPKNKQSDTKLHRVSLKQDSLVVFPELYMPVYIHGTTLEKKRFAEMFVRGYCYKVDAPRFADLVIFAGSKDVDPKLYGEEPHRKTQKPNIEEDVSGVKLFQYCRRHGIPMMGVCKGAQLLHVCMGGKLYQHIDNHFGDHYIDDLVNNQKVQKVSSLHHQSCIPNKDMRILATTKRSSEKWRNPSIKDDANVGLEIEAFFYPKAGIIGFQGHPEYKGYDFYAAWCLKMIEDLIVCGVEFNLNSGVRRLNSELISTRTKDKKICVD